MSLPWYVWLLIGIGAGGLGVFLWLTIYLSKSFWR